MLKTSESSLIDTQKHLIQLENQIHIQESQFSNEINEQNQSLATLNKEKVNLMREMTLIHENNLKLEQELLKFKDLAISSQQEIENYQNQIELYAKVMGALEEKVGK